MTGYADIIYLTGAMVIYSILAMQVNQIVLRNNIVQMESGVEYQVATHAQDYADQIHLIENKSDLDSFINEFPRTDSIAYDRNDPSAYLMYDVDIVESDTTLPHSHVNTKVIHIRMENQFLNNQGASNENIFRLKLIKSFED